ncbi:RICIN domain-containing protein [Streptomyces afghaniensis]|uniref:RICIN domain-containing protein n=1 Tax=Streptomyces afghaniensis TaxID=66865 RepID=UPI00358E5B30
MGSQTTVIGTVTALMTGLLVAPGAPAAQAATVDTNAWYVMVNRSSGKALDVAGASSADGAAITQWARHDATPLARWARGVSVCARPRPP